jgi:hypothetical protein
MTKWSKALPVRSGKLSNVGLAYSILLGQIFIFNKFSFTNNGAKIFCATFCKRIFRKSKFCPSGIAHAGPTLLNLPDRTGGALDHLIIASRLFSPWRRKRTLILFPNPVCDHTKFRVFVLMFRHIQTVSRRCLNVETHFVINESHFVNYGRIVSKSISRR